MSLDQPEKLATLIRLRVPPVWLEIYRFGYAGTPEYVMASIKADEAESEALNQIDHINEGDVVH